MEVLGRFFAALIATALALAALLAGLILLWRFQPPVSTLMIGRWLTGQSVERDYVPLDRISAALPVAVLMSEDGQFCRHRGVDWKALGQVLDEADDDDGPSRGASTLTMQVVKNLFLWPGRSAIRKGLEIPLALLLDAAWPKRRIMEVYLNIAEWGDGVFGAQAGARKAFGKDAAALSPREAALMASALPNPVRRNPGRPTRAMSAHATIVMSRAQGASEWTDCLR